MERHIMLTLVNRNWNSNVNFRKSQDEKKLPKIINGVNEPTGEQHMYIWKCHSEIVTCITIIF
jgi:hypothetical protein